MDVRLFDYSLPPERIAQEPLSRRDSARLLLLPREPGPLSHHVFKDLPDLLEPGDLLVLNDTRVVPARLQGRRPSGGQVEIFVLQGREEQEGAPEEKQWERDCFLRASRRPKPGESLLLPDDATARVLVDHGDGRARLLFTGQHPARLLARHGSVPLPPYIKRKAGDPRAAQDRIRYQTVFARREGAVAAPTAGLHFTRALLDRLAAGGVETAWVTLHVGPGTFRPVTASRAEDHRLDPEQFVLPPATAAAVAATRARGGRVIACGTTVVRTLESRSNSAGVVSPGAGLCELFILPGYRFKIVDGLLTNFHLPRSSLLMLVSAMGGRERILGAYREAMASGYRFYSYGDAMFVAPSPASPA